jgi:hypothetical protein
MSIQCGLLTISQTYRPSRPVKRRVFFSYHPLTNELSRNKWLYRVRLSPLGRIPRWNMSMPHSTFSVVFLADVPVALEFPQCSCTWLLCCHSLWLFLGAFLSECFIITPYLPNEETCLFATASQLFSPHIYILYCSSCPAAAMLDTHYLFNMITHIFFTACGFSSLVIYFAWGLEAVRQKCQHSDIYIITR